MLRFFNPLSRASLQLTSLAQRRFVWQNVITARPPLRQQDVFDHSVLHASGGSNFLRVVKEAEFCRAGSKISGGRSKGHKLMRQLADGTHEFYYFKLPYYRWGFVKELIAGALARELMGELAPMVCAIEMSSKNEKGLFQYGLISQSLGSNLHYDNLENWAFQYKEDFEEEKFGPKHLGCGLAFKLLLGDSDAKAANFVLLRDQQGHVYGIDNEYAFDLAPEFITDASVAVKRLKDFHIAESDSQFVPLQMEPELLKKIFPVFVAAVQHDIDSGELLELYRKFADLSLSRLKGLFNQFGPLINDKEQESLLKDLLARQQMTLKFITEHDSAHLHRMLSFRKSEI